MSLCLSSLCLYLLALPSRSSSVSPSTSSPPSPCPSCRFFFLSPSGHPDRGGDPHRLSEQHQGVQRQLLQRELRLPQQPEHNVLRLRQQLHVAHQDSSELLFTCMKIQPVCATAEQFYIVVELHET